MLTEELKKSDNLSYKDPDNYVDIMEDIKECKTYKDCVDFINKVFPKWILGWPKRYCEDYPHFQDNWEIVCEQSKCKPASIVIVDYINFDKDNYKVLNMFCELLTMFGHSVRRKEEFIGCKVCGDAIPNKDVYNKVVTNKIAAPNCWSLKCTKC